MLEDLTEKSKLIELVDWRRISLEEQIYYGMQSVENEYDKLHSLKRQLTFCQNISIGSWAV